MLEVNATLQGFSRIDFNRSKVRKSMRLLGRDVQKQARRLVARRAISGAGEYPGRHTGALWRAIKYRVSKPGFMVVVRPDKTAEMGKFFYPAVLQYGSKKRNIEKRKNYMEAALDSRRDYVRNTLRNTLQDALVPRK